MGWKRWKKGGTWGAPVLWEKERGGPKGEREGSKKECYKKKNPPEPAYKNRPHSREKKDLREENHKYKR